MIYLLVSEILYKMIFIIFYVSLDLLDRCINDYISY